MKIGLIGINSVKEENHFIKIYNAFDKQLHGFFSPHSEEILPISQNYKVELYYSANELFEKADAIYFANSLNPNYDFAIDALKKSCHLFIEDISALTFEETRLLYKVASEAGTNIQIKLPKSYSPEYTEIEESISDPKLIELNKNYTSLLRHKDYFNEILNNLHLANLSINSNIKKTSTVVLPIDPNHYSLVQIRLDYNNGAIVNMIFNNISSSEENTMNLYQKNNVININFREHITINQKLINGHVERQEFIIKEVTGFNNELNSFIKTCKNHDLQNISESPQILKIIQNTHLIMERLKQISNHIQH